MPTSADLLAMQARVAGSLRRSRLKQNLERMEMGPPAEVGIQPKPMKRIRQGEIKLRPWENEWKASLEASGDWVNVKGQSIRVRLANGAWYKPDITAKLFGQREALFAWEVKGGKKMKGVAKGILALKVAAALYPEIVWILVWKEAGSWRQQIVEP